MKIVSDYKSVNHLKWSEFVLNHPQGSVFQAPEFTLVCETTKNYFPIVFLAIENKEIIGVLAGVVQKEIKGLLGFFTSRCIIQGGPLAKENDSVVIENLITAYNETIKRKALYTQFRNLFNIRNLEPVFKKYGYDYEPHLDIHINLNQPFEELKKTIHKSRLRNCVKSLNKGAQVLEINEFLDIEKGYELIKETYSRIKLPMPDFSHFKSLYNVFQKLGYLKCFGVYFEEEMIAFRMSLIYKNIVYDYFAGSSKNHSNKYPNDVLIMETLKWGCLNGFNYFDFGGAGKPGIPYGVREHKLNFSKNIVEFGRFEKIHYPLIYRIIKLVFKLWIKMKK